MRAKKYILILTILFCGNALSENVSPRIRFFGAHFKWDNIPGFVISGSPGDNEIERIIISRERQDADPLPIAFIQIKNHDDKSLYSLQILDEKETDFLIESMGENMKFYISGRIIILSDPDSKNKINVKIAQMNK
jgi:hypothetical protein